MSSQSNSQTSGRTSPTKSFPVVGLNNHRLDSVTMDPNHKDMPSGLAELVMDMGDFAYGKEIIPRCLEDEILKRTKSDLSLRRLGDNAYYPSDETASSPMDIASAMSLMLTARKLVKRAGQCHHLQYDETGWNNLVHTPLLDAVLNDQDPLKSQLVDFSPCMTASITSRFHYFPIPPTKVDYVLYIDAESENSAACDAITKLEETEGSVNHTTFRPLGQYPISLSIETKRHGGDVRKADVQLAAWQAAQWAFLESQAGDGLGELAFLPGIIVQGHEWKFVATTWSNGKTTLWSSHQFGTTMTSVGVFQIMAGIRRLRRWSTDVFWPWYKKNVLRLDLALSPSEQDALPDQLPVVIR